MNMYLTMNKIKQNNDKNDLKDANRYRWLRDNGHLNQWWSVQGAEHRCDNIDDDIDEAMAETDHAVLSLHNK